MRRRSLIVMVALLLGLLGAAPALAAPAATRTATMSGFEVFPGFATGMTRVGATFVGTASGDLPGAWAVTVDYSPPAIGPAATNTIVGGSWYLAVYHDGEFDGVLWGDLAGGTVQWNAAGDMATLDATLTIVGGTGEFGGLKGGGGTFSGQLSHQDFPPTLGGTLALTH
ncbi:MAG TPA: hypothetical protein VFW96_19185 [Thermomicrobiales bacterium]|nr:hypothetical protein [Thermomicrobiales bacterium]